MSYTPRLPGVDFAVGKSIILTESALIVNFLLDMHASPTHQPTTSTIKLDRNTDDSSASQSVVDEAYKRYRMSFFVDTYFDKINPLMFKVVREPDAAERESKAIELANSVGKHLEPLLHDAKPFFAGGSGLSSVEVCTTASGQM